MRRAPGPQRTWLDPRPVVAEIRECEGIRDEGWDEDCQGGMLSNFCYATATNSIGYSTPTGVPRPSHGDPVMSIELAQRTGTGPPAISVCAESG